jgi:hypothetical protein
MGGMVAPWTGPGIRVVPEAAAGNYAPVVRAQALRGNYARSIGVAADAARRVRPDHEKRYDDALEGADDEEDPDRDRRLGTGG